MRGQIKLWQESSRSGRGVVIGAGEREASLGEVKRAKMAME
jgi:hypothetical protein